MSFWTPGAIGLGSAGNRTRNDFQVVRQFKRNVTNVDNLVAEMAAFTGAKKWAIFSFHCVESPA